MKHNLRSVRLILVLLVAVSLLAPLGARAQTGTGNVEVRFENVDPGNFPTISTLVTVLDPEGLPLSGLDASNFEVFEDGQRVPVSGVESVINPDVTIAVALVVDISGSMFQEIGEARTQAAGFVQNLAANDLLAVIAFRGKGDEAPNLDEPFPQINPEREIDFTNDKAAVQALIDALDVPDPEAGRTSLYDALFKAVRMTSRVKGADYRLVMAFTDGNEKCPNCGGSLLKPQDPITEAQKHGIPVFTIGLGEDADEDYLKRMALTTAGTYNYAPTPDKLAAIYQDVADQLKQQYVITYQAKAPADGKEHKLDVKVSTDRGEGSNVLAVQYPCPEKPGVRLFYLQPSDVAGQQDSVLELENDLEIDKDLTEFTLVPDISACNPIAKAELYLDGELKFAAENKPFHLLFDFYDLRRENPGEHQLVVLAYDDAGNVSDQVGVNIQVPGSHTVTPPPSGTPTPTPTPDGVCAGVAIGSLCLPRWVLAVAGVVLILLLLAAILLLTRPKRREPEPPPYVPMYEDSTAPETPIVGFQDDLTLPEMESGPETLVGDPDLGQPPLPMPPPVVAPMPSSGEPQAPPPAATEILQRQPQRLGWLIVEQGDRVGQEFRLGEADTSIGRSGTNDVVLSDNAVSRQHAKIRLESDGYVLYDLAATNPTIANGQEISRHTLTEGDRVQLGNVVMVFKEMQSG